MNFLEAWEIALYHLVFWKYSYMWNIVEDARVSALEVSLGKLGVQNLNKDDVQRMHWDTLKIKTRNWNQYMQIAVKVLLAGERKNCDLVFDGITFNKDRCFAELAGPSFKTLLSFGNAVAKSAKSKMSPEKLSVLLDMYGVMHEVQPQINVIFQGRFCSEMREAALNLTKRLAQMAQETLVDFVDAVEKDTENTIQDENVHPLTLHVIGCAESLLDYKSTLEILQPFETDSANESQLAVVTKKILQALGNNLNGRFKLYKDSALGHIFLVNNIHYMVMSIRRSQASDILEDWVKRHRKIVEKISWQYRRLVWDKIINKRLSDPSKRSDDSCSRKSSSSLTESDMRAMVKESFKSFNTEFGALLAKQSQWNIPDMELRQYLRLAVAEVLVQAYKSFVDQFGKYARREKKKNPDKYIKYTPEEVEKKLLDELFAGKPTGAPNQFDEDRQ